MNQESYRKLGIALIVIAAIIRLVFALSHAISGDACWHLASARFIAENNKIPLFDGLGRLEPFWPPPVFHLLAAFFYKIFGTAGLRLVSPLFATLTAITSWMIARKIFDYKTAFYSMLFLNFTPLFLDYGILGYVDSTAAFFSVLSIYFMLDKKTLLSSASLGIALLAKYNAVFTLPMLIYLAYKYNRKKTKIFIVLILPFVISSVWFIRNFALLGNPVWPFLNGLFNGVKIGAPFNSFNFMNIVSASPYLTTYLEFFGVPNGNLLLLSFYKIPYKAYLLPLWVLGTLIFIFPFVKEIFSRAGKNREFIKGIGILFLSYLAMLFIYLFNTGWFGARLLLPVLPFMAILWSRGMLSIKAKKVYCAAIILICTGFIAAEAVKVSIAKKEWGVYSQDFEWAKINSNPNDVFYGNGQCLSFNINRIVIDHTAPLDLDKVRYVWANEKWRIDFPMNSQSMEKIRDSGRLEAAYANANTGTTIYKVIQ